jgi:NADPH:quinone reductase-like Zn-dependent oxidoreductase
MPAHAFTKAPAGYTHVEAATLTCAGVTAWRGLVVCGRVKPGDTVLILGTGGVSLFALQFTKAAGALTGFAGEVSIPALFSNQIRISGISIGSRADQEDMIRAITGNRLKPVIDRRFLLQEIVVAFQYYESQEHFGKVCLEL